MVPFEEKEAMKHPLLPGRRSLVVLIGWIVACLVAAPAVLVFYLGDVPVQFGKGYDNPIGGSLYNATEQDVARFPWLNQMLDWHESALKYCSSGCQICSCPYAQPPLLGVVQRDAIANALHLQKFGPTGNGEIYYYDYFSYQGAYYNIRLGSPDLSGYLFYGTIAAGAGALVIGIIWAKRLSLPFSKG